MPTVTTTITSAAASGVTTTVTTTEATPEVSGVVAPEPATEATPEASGAVASETKSGGTSDEAPLVGCRQGKCLLNVFGSQISAFPADAESVSTE